MHFIHKIDFGRQSVGRSVGVHASWPYDPFAISKAWIFFLFLFGTIVFLANEIFFDDDDFISFAAKKSCDNHDHDDDIDTRSSLNVMNDMII